MENMSEAHIFYKKTKECLFIQRLKRQKQSR